MWHKNSKLFKNRGIDCRILTLNFRPPRPCRVYWYQARLGRDEVAAQERLVSKPGVDSGYDLLDRLQLLGYDPSKFRVEVSTAPLRRDHVIPKVRCVPGAPRTFFAHRVYSVFQKIKEK